LKRIVVRAEECAGCRQCEMVCSFQHSGRFSPSLARVTVHRDDLNGLDYPVMCRQCSDCPPMESCPVVALSREAEGVVVADWQLCTGCGLCVQTCRYGAVKMHEGRPLICNMCEGQPQCVERCPTAALEHVEAPEFTETPEEAFRRMKEAWSFHE